MLEDSVAARWILDKLTASAALTALVGTKISDDHQPQGSTGPYVVYQMQASDDKTALGGIRVYTDMDWLVRGYMQTRSYAGTLGQIAEAIDAALNNQTGAATGGHIYTCRRVEPRRQVDPDDPSWRFRGGLYRLFAQAT
jgi:hypothetical protein